MRWSTVGIALWFALGAACSPGKEGSPRLVLEAVRTLPLSDTASVTGGAVDQQRLLIWGPHRLWQFKMSPNDSTGVQIDSPEAAIVAAELDGDGALALHWTSSNALRLTRVTPYRKQLAEWRVPFRPEVARKCAGSWYVAGRDRGGFYQVFRLGEGHAAPVWASAYATALLTPYNLSCLADRIAVTDVPAPFSTTAIAISPDVEAVILSPQLDSTDFGTALFPTWISSPVFPLGQRSLQILAELRGDGRLLVLYDSTGRELRRRGLESPVGFLATSDHGPYILATRRARGTNVIVYRWRWVESFYRFHER